MKEIFTLKEEVWDEYLIALKNLLMIPSVEGIPEKNAPFGLEPKKALEYIVSLAKTYGLESFIINDSVAVVEWGTGNEYVAALGHVDVVAAGTGWNYEPYDLTEANGKFYGRGILDNKGPILSCLFALIQLKQLGIEPNQKIRILFGSNEETGMKDVEKYLEKEKPPLYGFTPDCKYPVVYGERGIVDFTIDTSFAPDIIEDIFDIQGDFTKSSVPDECEMILASGEKVKAIGKRSPSNAPELGENAITLLSGELREHKSLNIDLQKYFSWIFTSLHEKHYGDGLDIAFVDEDSGKLILTPYSLIKEEDSLQLSISIRFPISVTTETILARINENLPNNSVININRELPSHIFDKEHPIVRALSDVYQAVTGLDATPVTTTGATYARKMPNIFAFGPSFPGQKGIAHNSDEYMDVSDLRKNFEIYLNAIYQLVMRDDMKK